MRIKRVLAAVLAALLLAGAIPAVAGAESQNPLLNSAAVSRLRTEDEFLNLLLLGLDLGFEGYIGSGGKTDIEQAHTDLVMVVAINKTKNTISLISLPRDTVVYVPEVRGIYKLNAAFNCSTGVRTGLRRTSDTVSWLLGGVKIDAYAAVDMQALVMLGDALGGVDFDLEMAYTGSSGTYYEKGLQHLDGMGIMDYVRARTNATEEGTDEGRTERGRRMVAAIIKKLLSNWQMVSDLWSLSQKSYVHFYTNLSGLDTLASLWQVATKLGSLQIGSYALSGDYGLAMSEWNFTFTDQENRRRLIRDVYGAEAEDLPFVSKDYLDWLMDQGGLTTARAIRQTEIILEYARRAKNPSAAMKAALAACEAIFDATSSAFDAAAASRSAADTARMTAMRREMISNADQVAQAFGYTKAYSWELTPNTWFEDPLINEFSKINWQ